MKKSITDNYVLAWLILCRKFTKVVEDTSQPLLSLEFLHSCKWIYNGTMLCQHELSIMFFSTKLIHAYKDFLTKWGTEFNIQRKTMTHFPETHQNIVWRRDLLKTVVDGRPVRSPGVHPNFFLYCLDKMNGKYPFSIQNIPSLWDWSESLLSLEYFVKYCMHI